jgi:hypothetical protein
MKRTFLISAAAAVLTLGMAAADAQQAPRDHGAPARAQQPQQYPSAPPRSERNEAPRAQSQSAPRSEASERGNLNARSTTGSAPRDESARSEKQPSARPPAASTAAGTRGENRNVQREEQRQNASTPRQQQPSQAGRSDRFERNANERSNSRNASERFNSRNAQQQQMRSQERITTGSSPSGARNGRTATDRTGGRAAQPENRAARGDVNLTTEQRTRVTERFAARIDSIGVRPISRSRISVRVGASIPRSIQLYDVPADVIAIYPQFRRDRFVLVEDEIVVVEPGSRRIVAVLPRGGQRTAVREPARETTGSATSSDRLRLSAEDRREIRTVVLRDPECRYEARLDFSFLIPLPRSVRVCEFPQTVVSEVPEIERYRFVVRGDDIVVVDPDEYRVVDVIR